MRSVATCSMLGLPDVGRSPVGFAAVESVPLKVSASVSNTPYAPHTFPVSVKGVVVRGGRVLLLRNERDGWELPGGKIELGETPEECLAREVEEETGWPVTVTRILDSWMYHITQVGKHVFIVTYGCHVDSDAPVVASSEHKEAGLFTEDEVPHLTMPQGYKRSVLDWFAQLKA